MVRRFLLIAVVMFGLGFAGARSEATIRPQGSPGCGAEVLPVCITGRPVCICLDYAKVDCIYACR